MSNLGNRDVFARNLKYYTDRSGKTQKELAELVGVATSTFNDWIKGKKYPRMDKVEILADFFKILKSDLIEDKQKQSTESELSEVKQALIHLVEGLSESEAAVLLASLKSGLGK